MEKRSFSLTESKLLLEIVQKYKEKIENKATDALTSSEKKQAWEVLVVEYNSQGMTPRSSTTLQNKWKQLKKFSKKTVAAERRSYLQTGGGPAVPTPKFLPESLQQLVEGIMSSVSMKGNENSFDSNADFAFYKDRSNNNSTLCVEEMVTLEEAMEGEENISDNASLKPAMPEEPSSEVLQVPCEIDDMENQQTWTSYKPAMLKKPSSKPIQVPHGKPQRNFEQYRDNLNTKQRVLQLQEEYYTSEQSLQGVVNNYWITKTKNEEEARLERILREARAEKREMELHNKRMQKEEEIITQNKAKFEVEKALLQAQVKKCLQK